MCKNVIFYRTLLLSLLMTLTTHLVFTQSEQDIYGWVWWRGSLIDETIEDMNLGLDNISVTMDMDDEQSACIGEVHWIDIEYDPEDDNIYHVYPGYPAVGNIYNNGTSVADLILLQKHLISNPEFDNNWDKVSADADGDEDIDSDDLDKLDSLNLGHINTLPVPAFRFVHYDNRSSFQSGSLSNAFSKIIDGYNEETFYGSDLGFLAKWYFHGLKVGDFNASNSYYRDLNTDCGLRLPAAFAFWEQVDHPAVSKEDAFSIDVVLQEALNLAGSDIHLVFDPESVQVKAIESDLPGFADADYHITPDSRLHARWINIEGVKMPKKTRLFSIKATAINDIGDIRRVVTEIPQSHTMEIVDPDGNILDIGKVGIRLNKEIFDEDVRLFPNPSSSHLDLLFGGGLEDINKEIMVTNLSGNILVKKTAGNVSTFKLEVDDLSAGIYILSVLNDGAISARKKFTVMR